MNITPFSSAAFAAVSRYTQYAWKARFNDASIEYAPRKPIELRFSLYIYEVAFNGVDANGTFLLAIHISFSHKKDLLPFWRWKKLSLKVKKSFRRGIVKLFFSILEKMKTYVYMFRGFYR